MTKGPPLAVRLEALPPHVESWAVAKIPNFVAGVMDRWRRAKETLPPRFILVLCPRVEITARGGLPATVMELTDPRLRCHHFTGCHKPYLAMLLVGEDAEERRRVIQENLSWSEGYAAEVNGEEVRLRFIAASEDVGDDDGAGARRRTVGELLASGEIVSIFE